MTDNNIDKSDPSNEGQSGKDTVNEPGDINEPLTLEEAKATLEANEGETEAEIKKLRFKKDNPEKIPQDLKDLKKEQEEKKKEVIEKQKEVKEATTEAPTEIPDKFKNKTPEEIVKLSRETESYNTKLSQKNKELEAQLADLAIVNQKIADMEKESVIKQQKAVNVKLPPKPAMELFYEDPEKYFVEQDKYMDAVINSRLMPLYGDNWDTKKENIIKQLDKNTKDAVIPYATIEKEVQARVRQNPALVNKYGLNATAVAYEQVVKERLPQRILEIKAEAKEEAKQELLKEQKENNSSQIMTSDITTYRRGSKPAELGDMLDKGASYEDVITAYKRKYPNAQVR